jgi:DNA-binding PadR family transcriptional regulator
MSSHTTRILQVLGERGPGPANPSELLDAARIPPGIGYPILHRLCDRGLLTRIWNTPDLRICHYTLTPLATSLLHL